MTLSLYDLERALIADVDAGDWQAACHALDDMDRDYPEFATRVWVTIRTTIRQELGIVP